MRKGMALAMDRSFVTLSLALGALAGGVLIKFLHAGFFIGLIAGAVTAVISYLLIKRMF
jgi:hypothetical protein